MRGTCSAKMRCKAGSTRWASTIALTSSRITVARSRDAISLKASRSSCSISRLWRATSAATSASLLGKYWEGEPTLTPAVAAIRLVLARSYPCLVRTRAVASSSVSTVTRDRFCEADFRGIVGIARAMVRHLPMRVDNVSHSSQIQAMQRTSPAKGTAMFTLPYRTLMHYKRWATNGLNAVIAENLDRLPADERILVRGMPHPPQDG